MIERDDQAVLGTDEQGRPSRVTNMRDVTDDVALPTVPVWNAAPPPYSHGPPPNAPNPYFPPPPQKESEES
jgi:hypothetical protein